MKHVFTIVCFLYSSFYLTAQIAPSPGGVGRANLTAWFKATDLANGNVTSWTTAYPTGSSAITVTEAGSPYPVATNTPSGNTSNYNTTIYFDTTNLTNNYSTNLRGLINTSSLNLLDNVGAGDEGSFFGCYHYPNHYDNNDHMMEYNESGAAPYDGIQFRQLATVGRIAIGRLSNNSSNACRNYTRTFMPEIVSYRGNRSTSSSMQSYKDSRLSTASSASQCSGPRGLVFGYKPGSASSQYKGFLNEFIFFNRDLTDSEMRRVDSYLAVKYGITLSNSGGGTQGDYHGSDDVVVWDASDNPTYHNHVIGVSMDSASGLYQLQSHTFDDTTRVYRGSNLQASNSMNTATFNDEISYIMVGHNQGNMFADTISNLEMPASTCGAVLTSRIGREWKVTKTDAAQSFSVDLTLNTNANQISVNPLHLRLLVDDDGDFSNGGTICYADGDSSLSITYNNPVVSITNIRSDLIPNDATSYFTLASIDLATPLPVDLSYIDVKCDDGFPTINWYTETETNNDFFTIEMSDDGMNFEEIDRVNGAGNSSSSKSYNWKGEKALKGMTYFRLKQSDFDGNLKYFETAAVLCETSTVKAIYPNPFTDNFIVHISGDIDSPIEIEVLDCLGRQVHKQTSTSNISKVTLNEKFPKGTYFLKVRTQAYQMVERIVKTE